MLKGNTACSGVPTGIKGTLQCNKRYTAVCAEQSRHYVAYQHSDTDVMKPTRKRPAVHTTFINRIVQSIIPLKSDKAELMTIASNSDWSVC